MQDNQENKIDGDQNDLPPDAADEHLGRTVIAVSEDYDEKGRPRKNRGKQILSAVTEITGVQDVYETIAAVVKKDENSSPKEKRKKVLGAVLEITGAQGVYDDAVGMFQRKDKTKEDEEVKLEQNKKQKGKNIFKKIVQAVKLTCETGIFVCKCLMKVVGPGVYVIEKILEKTLVVAKTAYKAAKADNKKERREIIASGAIELIGWGEKTDKLQRKLQGAVKTVHTASGVIGAMAEEPNVDGLIGAAVIVGKEGMGKTKAGQIVREVNKYGEKLRNELQTEAPENKLSFPHEPALTDVRQDETVPVTEIITDNSVEISSPAENAAAQAENHTSETAAVDFKDNLLSGHQRLQEARAKVAARRGNTENNTRNAMDDIALIRSLRVRPAQQAVTRQPQSFSAERMLQLQQCQHY